MVALIGRIASLSQGVVKEAPSFATGERHAAAKNWPSLRERAPQGACGQKGARADGERPQGHVFRPRWPQGECGEPQRHSTA